MSTPRSFITFETRVTITSVSASYQGARLVSLLARDRCPRCSWVFLKRLHSTLKQFELSDPGSSCVLTGTDVRLSVSRYSVLTPPGARFKVENLFFNCLKWPFYGEIRVGVSSALAGRRLWILGYFLNPVIAPVERSDGRTRRDDGKRFVSFWYKKPVTEACRPSWIIDHKYLLLSPSLLDRHQPLPRQECPPWFFIPPTCSSLDFIVALLLSNCAALVCLLCFCLLFLYGHDKSFAVATTVNFTGIQ